MDQRNMCGVYNYIHMATFKNISFFLAFCGTVHIAKRSDIIPWFAICGSSTHRRTRNRWHIWSPGKILSPEHELLCKSIDLKISRCLTWPWHDLQKSRFESSKVLDDVIESNDRHYRYIRAKWSRKHVSHSMLMTYRHLWAFCGTTLTF